MDNKLRELAIIINELVRITFNFLTSQIFWFFICSTIGEVELIIKV